MYDEKQAKEEKDDSGLLFLPAEAKGVPHEKFNGRRSMTVAGLLNNPGFVVDEHDVLEGFYDAPGLVVKTGAEGRPEVVRQLNPGERGGGNKFRSESILIPADGQPCPDGCGGKLKSINNVHSRCEVCGGVFKDNAV